MSYDKTSASCNPASITHKAACSLMNNCGFTFVELITVTAIIGILTIIAFPAFNEMKLMTQNARATTELRDMEKIIIAYAIDRGGAFPADLSVVNLHGARDPWGAPYQYSTVTSRTDIFGQLLNPGDDFDLYSKGSNGQSVAALDDPLSLDDIVRAGGGRYIGPAERFVPE